VRAIIVERGNKFFDNAPILSCFKTKPCDSKGILNYFHLDIPKITCAQVSPKA
jgi:hypothetical protein